MTDTVIAGTRGVEAQAAAPSSGLRFSLYPMTDSFAAVILDALADAPGDGLEVATDDVSTYLAGDPDAMLCFVEQVVVAASRRTRHVACTLLLSRGCPGEEACAPDGATPAGPLPGHDRRSERRVQPTGVRAAAHFSLYPLGTPSYMGIIEAEIERAKEAGLYARAEHFTSRLEGDLAEVLSAIGDSWARADASHVVAHATISVGSPTRPQP